MSITYPTLATYRSRVANYLTLSPFSVLDIFWSGASHIVLKWKVTVDNPFSFLRLPSIPDDANFCLCVSWITGTGTARRYKIWDWYGEILYVEKYNNQIIPTEFYIEVWSMTDEISAVLTSTLLFLTSNLTSVDNICDDPVGSAEGTWEEVSDEWESLAEGGDEIECRTEDPIFPEEEYLIDGCLGKGASNEDFVLLTGLDHAITRGSFIRYDLVNDTLEVLNTSSFLSVSDLVYDEISGKFIGASSVNIVIYDPILNTVDSFNPGYAGGVSCLIYVPEKEKVYACFYSGWNSNSYIGVINVDSKTVDILGMIPEPIGLTKGPVPNELTYSPTTECLYGVWDVDTNKAILKFDLSTNTGVHLFEDAFIATSSIWDSTRNLVLILCNYYSGMNLYDQIRELDPETDTIVGNYINDTRLGFFRFDHYSTTLQKAIVSGSPPADNYRMLSYDCVTQEFELAFSDYIYQRMIPISDLGILALLRPNASGDGFSTGVKRMCLEEATVECRTEDPVFVDDFIGSNLCLGSDGTNPQMLVVAYNATYTETYLYTYNLSTDALDYQATYTGYLSGGIAFDPVNNKFVFGGDGSITLFDLSDKSFDTFSSGLLGYVLNPIYVPEKSLVYAVVGRNVDNERLIGSINVGTKVVTSLGPIPTYSGSKPNPYTLTYSPISDAIYGPWITGSYYGLAKFDLNTNIGYARIAAVYATSAIWDPDTNLLICAGAWSDYTIAIYEINTSDDSIVQQLPALSGYSFRWFHLYSPYYKTIFGTAYDVDFNRVLISYNRQSGNLEVIDASYDYYNIAAFEGASVLTVVIDSGGNEGVRRMCLVTE